MATLAGGGSGDMTDVLRVQERRVRWAGFAGDLALIGCFVGGVYVAFGVIGWSGWTIPMLMAFLALVGKVHAGRSGRVAQAQRARQEWLRAEARDERRPPLLVLRSFESALT